MTDLDPHTYGEIFSPSPVHARVQGDLSISIRLAIPVRSLALLLREVASKKSRLLNVEPDNFSSGELVADTNCNTVLKPVNKTSLQLVTSRLTLLMETSDTIPNNEYPCHGRLIRARV